MYIHTHTNEIKHTYIYSDRTRVPAMAAGLYTTKQSVRIYVHTHTYKRNKTYIYLF